MAETIPYQRELAKIAASKNIDAYYIGGIIRDRLLGRPNKDIDIVTTNAAPEKLLAGLHFQLPNSHLDIAGRYGTAQLRLADGIVIEGVRARSESYELTSRKPTVSPGTLLEDVMRRDFTINCLLSPLIAPDDIQDLTGQGLSDLASRTIRTPLAPEQTFSDDPLRMLRAIRFTTQLGFAIEPITLAGIKASVKRISIVSIERIQVELDKIMLSPTPSQGIRLLAETGLLQELIPELVATQGVVQTKRHQHDVFEHSLRTLDLMPPDLALRWAGLLHDIGKPQTKIIDDNKTVHFIDHENVGADLSENILRRLRYPEQINGKVQRLTEIHVLPILYLHDPSDTTVRRIISTAGTLGDDLLTLAAADTLTSGTPDLTMLHELEARMRQLDTPNRAIARHLDILDGATIMSALKLNAGPEVGRVKKLLREAVIVGDLAPNDKDAALFWLQQKAAEIDTTAINL